MSAPLFPNLIPSATDPLWFTVDKPCDDENELSELEEEYQNWIEGISKKGENIMPIGKTAAEESTEDSANVFRMKNFDEDDEDEEDEGDDDDDESDTNDDELETDMIDDRDSPDEVDMEANGLALA